MLANPLDGIIDLFLGSKPADPKPDGRVGNVFVDAQGTEDVGWFERGRGACRAGREGDVFEGHEEGFAFDVGKGDVDAA
jgi:hypothetical protein